MATSVRLKNEMILSPVQRPNPPSFDTSLHGRTSALVRRLRGNPGGDDNDGDEYSP